jgi:hypothetical protein
MYVGWELADLTFNKLHKLRVFLNQSISGTCKVFPPFFACIYVMYGINGFTGDNRAVLELL